jgi:hypothetical protein
MHTLNAGVDSLITLIVIFLITVAANWIKKMKQQGEQPGATPPPNVPGPSRPAQTPPRSTSWEDELRRLLEGEAPAAPPSRPQPPIVIAQPRPQPAPTLRPVQPPPVFAQPSVALPQPVQVVVRAGNLASMEESRRAYERASQLDKSVSARIEKIPGEHVKPTTVLRRPPPPDIAQVVSLFKNSRTARQAVIASIILGPPVAFEESSRS